MQRRARGGTARRPRKGLTVPYLFLGPALILFIAFIAIPLIYTGYLSLMESRVEGGAYGQRVEVFAGLENYARSLTNPEFLASLGRLAIFALLTVPAMMLLALGFALALDYPRARLTSFSRLAIFLPYAVPAVIATLLWGFMYLPSLSPMNAALHAIGLPGIAFLESPEIYGSLANIALWGGVGFNMIVIYTALRSIPAELYEAARLDGASEWRIAWGIKTPLVAPAIVLTTLFSIIAALQTYSEPQTLKTLTDTIGNDFFPLMQVYRQAFATDDMYSAAATSLILAGGALILSFVVLGAARRTAREGVR